MLSRRINRSDPDASSSSQRTVDQAPPADMDTGGPVRAKKAAPTKETNHLIHVIVLGFFAAAILVIALFGGLISNYRSNTMQESAAHLTEINQELQLYIEAKIQGDWNATHSIANSVASGHLGSEGAMLAYLLRERNVWDVSSITLYTQDGYAVSMDGTVLDNDVASKTIAHLSRSGEFLTIMDSTLIFAVPVDTQAKYHGSRVVAVSVVQDLSSFLDNMDITSFDGTGYLYLTQGNGAVVSKQTREGAYSAYNLLPLLRSSVIQPLSGDAGSIDDILGSESCEVFLRRLAEGDQYIVSSPIQTGYDEMRLFYFVPVSVVNQTADSFSHYVLLLSVIMILTFAACAVVIFLYLYSAHKKQFDRDISLREHMLELLVQNSCSAFVLYKIGQKEPRFHAGNGVRITGETYYNLEKTDAGYRMRGSSGTESDALKDINSQLLDWDGRSEFRSTFVRNTAAATPSYFEIQLFPAESSGEKGTFVGIAQDVTPLYERQAATAEALAMAEQANQAKTRFLSNMSHDIRTPMNAIVNMTDFVLESVGEPETQRGYLNSLRESSAYLLQLINDVLDMSRIESGRMVVASAPFDLKRELDRIADITRPLCAEKRQRFETDFSGVRSAAILGDQVKLSQILINLLSNACKFTPEGGAVRFSAEDLPSLRSNVASIRFRVEDTGLGISKDDLKTIFEPFSRGDNQRISRIEGTGLGLSICRSYVNAMGGAIHCESEMDKGSVFTVELFFQTAEAAPQARPESAASENPFAGRRCLLCEDNPINQTIAAKILQRLGFAVEIAADGREGADRFISSAPGYYDAIYMDVQMPVMDGYQATAAIRGSAHPQAKSIPIIAMTANVFAEDVERARAAGMNGHLGKPILVNELIETTNTILHNGGKSHEENV